jgi:hypothetical protein
MKNSESFGRILEETRNSVIIDINIPKLVSKLENYLGGSLHTLGNNREEFFLDFNSNYMEKVNLNLKENEGVESTKSVDFDNTAEESLREVRKIARHNIHNLVGSPDYLVYIKKENGKYSAFIWHSTAETKSKITKFMLLS